MKLGQKEAARNSWKVSIREQLTKINYKVMLLWCLFSSHTAWLSTCCCCDNATIVLGVYSCIQSWKILLVGVRSVRTKNANAATYLHMHFLVTMPCSGCSQVNPMHVLFHCLRHADSTSSTFDSDPYHNANSLFSECISCFHVLVI